MILDEIKKANLQALKDKNTVARNLYSVLLNKIKLAEISKRESQEEVTENDVISILQKQAKELAEEKANYLKVRNQIATDEIELQEKIVASFLPEMMTEKEIEDIILQMEEKTIPTIMKKFKEEYAGKCDMRLVNQVARKVLVWKFLQ